MQVVLLKRWPDYTAWSMMLLGLGGVDWTTGLTILPQKSICRQPIQPLVRTIVRSCKVEVNCSKLGRSNTLLWLMFNSILLPTNKSTHSLHG